MKNNPILWAHLNQMKQPGIKRFYSLIALVMILFFFIFLPPHNSDLTVPLSETPQIFLPIAISIILGSIFIFNIISSLLSWKLGSQKWRVEISFTTWIMGKIIFILLLTTLILSTIMPLLLLARHYQDLENIVVISTIKILILTLISHGFLHGILELIFYKRRVISLVSIWSIILFHLLISATLIPKINPILLLVNLITTSGFGP